jgi:hypothetical protein
MSFVLIAIINMCVACNRLFWLTGLRWSRRRSRRRSSALRARTHGKIPGEFSLPGPSTQSLTTFRMIKDDRVKTDASRSLFAKKDVSDKVDVRLRD